MLRGLAGVDVAREPPTVKFMYYPEQTAPARLWSSWGEGLAVDGAYYSSLGDHGAPVGRAFLSRYRNGALTTVVDVARLLARPAGAYTPGKIHGRIDRGRDGKLYFSTHRGGTKVGLDPANRFGGDWILCYDPATGAAEVVAEAPLPGQSLPASLLDPDRMIFYAGTTDGANRETPRFLAYDVAGRKVLHSSADGPKRALALSRRTGRVYFTREGRLCRFDPSRPSDPQELPATMGMRTATEESPDGVIYGMDEGRLWALDTGTERVRSLGRAVVGQVDYVTSLDLAGRHLYFVAGAHGSSHRDGAPLVQYDLLTGRRKVIAYFHPYYEKRYGFTPQGVFGSAVSPDGSTVYLTWNGNRGGPDRRGRLRPDTVALMVVEIPASER